MYIMENQTVKLSNILKLFNKGGGVRGIGTQSSFYLIKFTQLERSMYMWKLNNCALNGNLVREEIHKLKPF